MYVKRIDLSSLVVSAAIAVRVGEPDRGAGAPSTPFASCSRLGTAYPAEGQYLPRDIREQLSAGNQSTVPMEYTVFCTVQPGLGLFGCDKLTRIQRKRTTTESFSHWPVSVHTIQNNGRNARAATSPALGRDLWICCSRRRPWLMLSISRC